MSLTHPQLLQGLLRLALGWVFFWAFLDKLFGLGFATPSGKAWIDGVSPTAGYLTNATHGPFAALFKGLAGSAAVDVLFMAGLALIGAALLLGIGVRVACASGIALMALMYVSGSLPPKTNPLVDDHVVYALLLAFLATQPSGDWLGLGRWWASLPPVQAHPWLR